MALETGHGAQDSEQRRQVVAQEGRDTGQQPDSIFHPTGPSVNAAPQDPGTAYKPTQTMFETYLERLRQSISMVTALNIQIADQLHRLNGSEQASGMIGDGNIQIGGSDAPPPPILQQFDQALSVLAEQLDELTERYAKLQEIA